MTRVTAGTGQSPSVEIRLLGGLSVMRDGVVLRDTELANRRARVLLKLLAAEHGRRVTVDRIVEALWPEQPPLRAADNVAVLVSRLRRTLGPESIGGNRAGYVLTSGDRVVVDVTRAEQLLAEAESRLASGQVALAGAAAARAVALLGAGVPVPDEDGEWTGPLRIRVAGLLNRALHAVADAGLRGGNIGPARDAARAALEADSFDEVAARQLMLAHARSGEPGRALAVFDALRTTLADALGVDPAPQTRELHLRILQEQPAEHLPQWPVPGVSRAGGTDEVVGRAAEVAALTAAWAAAVESRSALVLVTGEAGIGKTRLLEESVAIADRTGGRVLWARCYETERSLFLQPIVDALEPAVAHMPTETLRRVATGRLSGMTALFPQSSGVLETPPPEHGTADIERRQTYETVAELLRVLADERPVLLVLDDAHHAGLATVELLHYLARRASGGRLLIVAALRSEEGAETLRKLAPVANLLEVGPLAADAVEELARRAGLAERAAGIMSRTQGHTLFVVETVRALQVGEAGVPSSLRDAIAHRVARAGPEAEELLRAAAVLGASFEPEVVGHLVHLDATEAARRCEQLLSLRLVTVTGRSYEFAHDLVREVLYAATPAPTRFSYHLAAADLLVDRPEAEGWHASKIDDWARAARAWILAARQAADRYAHADADRLLCSALDAAEQAGDVDLSARAYAARGRVRETLGAYHDAERDLWAANRLAQQVGDRRLRMQVLRQLGGEVTVALGHPVRDCEELLQEALRLAVQIGDRPTEADVLARLAVLACNQLRFEEATALGARGLTAAQAADDERTTAIALDGVKATLAYLGDVDRLAEVIDILEPMLRRQGDLFLLQWTLVESAVIPFARGDWDGARRLVEDGLELNRRSGQGTYAGWFHAHLAWIARLQGQHDEAIERGRLALVETSGSHPWWNTFARAMLATTLAEVGDIAEAIGLLREGLQVADRGGTPAYRLRCLAALAELAGSEEILAEADAVLAAVSAPQGRAWLHGIDAYVAVAQAHLDREAAEAAAHVIGPVAEAARGCGHLPALAQARLVQARCAIVGGDRSAAENALDEVESLSAALGMPYVHGRAVALR
jgi:DNA-binding SARP family transcriptional activator/tetratricopeptide (TPR) repeat protein